MKKKSQNNNLEAIAEQWVNIALAQIEAKKSYYENIKRNESTAKEEL